MNDLPNRMLEFLTARLRPEGEASRGNRRLCCRSPILLSWQSPGGPQVIKARLLDISRAGAALLAATPPPLGARAMIRLTEGEGTPWVEAELIGVDVERSRRVKIRLRFLEPCPSFLLRMAVLGPVEPEADDAPAAPPAASAWQAWTGPDASPITPDRLAS